MNKYIIEVDRLVMKVEEVESDLAEKIVESGTFYFEIGCYKNINDAREKALKIRGLTGEK